MVMKVIADVNCNGRCKDLWAWVIMIFKSVQDAMYPDLLQRHLMASYMYVRGTESLQNTINGGKESVSPASPLKLIYCKMCVWEDIQCIQEPRQEGETHVAKG